MPIGSDVRLSVIVQLFSPKEMQKENLSSVPMSPDYFNERARCSFSHDGQDAHIGVTSKSYESRTLYFLCKHTLSFVQREWKRSIDFSHSIRELMSIPKFLLSSRLRNLRFRSKLLNEKRNHIYCISFLMLLKLQFSYNLSFKGFGSRPVVYSSTNVWGFRRNQHWRILEIPVRF